MICDGIYFEKLWRVEYLQVMWVGWMVWTRQDRSKINCPLGREWVARGAEAQQLHTWGVLCTGAQSVERGFLSEGCWPIREQEQASWTSYEVVFGTSYHQVMFEWIVSHDSLVLKIGSGGMTYLHNTKSWKIHSYLTYILWTIARNII